jgi:5-methylcytosine-specific restriction endonuclease McrA
MGHPRWFLLWATSVVKMRRCFTKLERGLLLARQGWLCGYCEKQLNVGDKIHVDHIIPFSKGGLTTMDNGVACCESCNLTKGATFHGHRVWQQRD